MTIKKKEEELNHINENNLIKANFNQLNLFEKSYASRAININELEKNLFKNLFVNILDKNEAEKIKKDETKDALINAIQNSLSKKKFEDIEKTEIKNAILYINEKYNLKGDFPKLSSITDQTNERYFNEIPNEKSKIFIN